MKKLFVGNLSWKTSEDNLKSLFESVGPVVSVRIIVDPYTGKSKGFGFVEMEDAESATKAIEQFNEKPFMERNIRVSSALERQERSREGGNRDFRGNGGGAGGEGRGSFRPRRDDRSRG
jgi:RNA recognition motif-containing protein